VAKDFGMSTNLAAEYPGKLKERHQVFLGETFKYKVLRVAYRHCKKFCGGLQRG